MPLSLRLGNAAVSYVAYIGKTVWPAKLAVFYPHPLHSLLWSDVIAAAVILVAITMAALYFYRTRYLLMGWFLFVTTLIPVIGIVQVGAQAMADRYAYIPCIGLFIITAWGFSRIVHATAFPRVVPAVAALCLILAFAAGTSRYLPYWQNGVKLWTQARIVAGRPDYLIEECLADAMLHAKLYDDALQHFREACVLKPDEALCHYNMSEILFHRHQLRDALEECQIAQSPHRIGQSLNTFQVLSCLIVSGEILLDLGDYEGAQMKLAAALQIDPNNNTALQLRQRAFNQESSKNR
jgi:tetratricopeptide (TPR) repeat protein